MIQWAGLKISESDNGAGGAEVRGEGSTCLEEAACTEEGLPNVETMGTTIGAAGATAVGLLTGKEERGQQRAGRKLLHLPVVL